MIELVTANGTLTIPGSYNELTSKKALKLIRLFHSDTRIEAAEVIALRILSGSSLLRFKLLPAETIMRCLKHIAWVFEENKLTTQLLPWYRRTIFHKKYYGPACGFDNLVMKEFHLTELFYLRITEGDQSMLDNLIAVLYRPAKKGYNFKKNTDGDSRVPLSHNEIDYHAKIVGRWPLPVKQLILQWYDACREQVLSQNERLKKASDSGYISQFNTGIYGLIRSLAGDKLGTIKDVENMPVLQCMLELNLNREQVEHFESQLNGKK